MTNTIVTRTPHADLGMPSWGRLRVADLRGLPVTTGPDNGVSAYNCALSQDIDWSAMTDAAVKGAFPGTSAWSPPI